MQENHNNCFVSKKRSTTLLQAKTGKHECGNVTVTDGVIFQSVIKPKASIENAHYLKIEFYCINRKINKVIRCIFTLIVIYIDFMHFRQKINFKIVFESFPSVSGYLKNSLKLTRANPLNVRT